MDWCAGGVWCGGGWIGVVGDVVELWEVRHEVPRPL